MSPARATVRFAFFSIATVVFSGSTKLAADESKINIGFRVDKWLKFHIHDQAEAEKQLKTFEMLGCEVKTSEHDGHTDIQVRAAQWKLLALASAEQAKQWSDWLKKTGFETLRGTPAKTTDLPTGEKREIVFYRLPATKSLHLHNAQDLAEKRVLMKALGCTVTEAKHSGHTDLKLECPGWMQVEFPTHAVAHQWQDYLNKLGFVTKHEH